MNITINDVDVTDFYHPAAGAIELSDVLNQPVTCSLALQSYLNAATPATALPFEIEGGELLSIFDDTQIFFDGIIPVEQGVGNDFTYFDITQHPTLPVKVVKLHGTDYQHVLDFVNQPDTVYYGKNSGEIIKLMLSKSLLAGMVDVSGISGGYLLPQYSVWGRKFSNVVTELAKMNGFYFSLTTTSLSPRRFKAEFQELTSRPAPFVVDAAAAQYDVTSLEYSPREFPLVNKVAIVGGNIPSDDIRVDTFTGDGQQGGFQLSSTPFYMQASSLLVSDYSQPLPDQTTLTAETPILWAGNIQAGSLQGNNLVFSGGTTLAYTTAFQCRTNRYLLFQEIRLDAGASIIVGMFTDPHVLNVGSVALGCWFRPEGTITVIVNGEEITPYGNPTWNPRDSSNANIYSVRIKQALDDNGEGTYIEIQGGNLSPERQWLPLLPPGERATAEETFGDIRISFNNAGRIAIGTASGLVPGCYVVITVGDYPTLPPYILAAEDIATNTTFTAKFYENLTNWFSGSANPVVHDYTCEVNHDMPVDIESASVDSDGSITCELHIGGSTAGWSNGDIVDIDSAEGLTVMNGGWPITVVDATHFKLVGPDGTGQEYVPETGTVHRRQTGMLFKAVNGGTVYGTYLLFRFYDTGGNIIFEIDDYFRNATNRGLTFGNAPTTFVPGLITGAGNGAIGSIIVRDPVGVDVLLKRATPVDLPIDPFSANYTALQDSQNIVILTCAAADDVSEHYSAQIVLDGGLPFLSFFADTSVPGDGDVLEVSYRYQVPLRVIVTDNASIALVASMSHIPGDTGLREATDVDVTGKLFTPELARMYGKQYLKDRSGMSLQGSVKTQSTSCAGRVLSGQALYLAINDRVETVAQVNSRHRGVLSQFDYEVSFGRIPEEFLLPTENPLIQSRPSALTYDVNGLSDVIVSSDEIKFTYNGS